MPRGTFERRPILADESTRAKGSLPVERVERRCLRCSRDFLAYGRFNRLCRTCAGLRQHDEYALSLSRAGGARRA